MDTSLRSSGSQIQQLQSGPQLQGSDQQQASGRLSGHQVSLATVQLPPQQVQAPPPANNNALQNGNVQQQAPTVPPLRASDLVKTALEPQGAPLKGHDVTSGDDLIKEMGREPKKNFKLFGIIGPRIWPHGKTYRNVVDKLDSYATSLNKPLPQQKGERDTAIKGLKNELRELDALLVKRLAKKDEPAIRELRLQVGREYRALERMEKTVRIPTFEGMNRFDQVLDAFAKKIPAEGFDDLAVYNDGNLKAGTTPRQLGSGAVNAVTLMTFDGTGPNGQDEVMVFKPLTGTVEPDAAGFLQIDEHDTRYANRNVAVSLVDQSLGLNLIPKTNFAMFEGQLGIVMEKAAGHSPRDPGSDRLALDQQARDDLEDMQDRVARAVANDLAGPSVPGQMIELNATIGQSGDWEIRPYEAENMDASHPEVMRQLSNLEWLDMLTCGADRHPGNYLIDMSGNPLTVKGIDNDFAFSGDKSRADLSDTTKTMVGKPKLIDEDTAQSFRDLGASWDDEGGLEEQLAPLLSEAELNVLKARLDALLEHIDDLEQDGRVVDDWSSFTLADGSTPHDVFCAPIVDRWTDKPSYVGELQKEIDCALDVRQRFS